MQCMHKIHAIYIYKYVMYSYTPLAFNENIPLNLTVNAMQDYYIWLLILKG